MKTLTTLSNINILNTEIEAEFIKNRYPLFPWQFILITPALNPEGHWYNTLMVLEKEYGLYLQLLHYFDTRDETDGITILNKLFEAIYSDMCCNDLIKRIQAVLPLGEETTKAIHKLTHFNEYRAKPEVLEAKISTLIGDEEARNYSAFDRK